MQKQLPYGGTLKVPGGPPPPPPLITVTEMNQHVFKEIKSRQGVAVNLKTGRFGLDDKMLKPLQPGEVRHPDPISIGPNSGGQPGRSYQERLMRANVIKKIRAKEEDMKRREEQKQEKKFSKMMASLKKKKKSDSSSDDSSSSSSDDSSSSTQQEPDYSEEEKEISPIPSMPSTVDTGPGRVVNPFQDTPHSKIMERYMFQETKQLQTLHKDSATGRGVNSQVTIDAMGRVPRLASPLPLPLLTGHHPSQNVISDVKPLGELPGSIDMGRILAVNANSLQFFPMQPSLASSSPSPAVAPNAQQILFTPEQQKSNFTPLAESVQKFQNNDTFGTLDNQMLDPSFSFQASDVPLLVQSRDGNNDDDRSEGPSMAEVLRQVHDQSKARFKMPHLHLKKKQLSPRHNQQTSPLSSASRNRPTKISERNLPIMASVYNSSQALSLRKTQRFQQDMEHLRKSQQVPERFVGPATKDKDVFRVEFEKSVKAYGHLMSNQTPIPVPCTDSVLSRHSKLNYSVDMSVIKESQQSGRNTILPKLSHTKQIESTLLSTFAAKAAATPKPGGFRIQQEKPSHIAVHLTRGMNQFRQFDSRFVKSPKLRHEFIKTKHNELKNQTAGAFKIQPRTTFASTQVPPAVSNVNSPPASPTKSIVSPSIISRTSKSFAASMEVVVENTTNSSPSPVKKLMLIEETPQKNMSPSRARDTFLSPTASKEERMGKAELDAQRSMVEQGRIGELNLADMPRSRMLLLQELDDQRKQDAYENFCRNINKKHENLDAEGRKEAFSLSPNVKQVIEMTDFMIQYKDEQQKAKEEMRGSMNTEDRLLQLNTHVHPLLQVNKDPIEPPQDQQSPRVHSPNSKGIKDIQKVDNFSRNFAKLNDKSLSSSQSSTSFAKLRDRCPTDKVSPAQQPHLCIVEKIALKFLQELWQGSGKYKVDASERERTRVIIDPTASGLGPEELKAHMAKYKQISCAEHVFSEEDRQKKRAALFRRFTLFYTDLLDGKHSKVSQEKLGAAFLDHIMSSKDATFKDLKQKILDSNIDKRSAFQKLRELNPEIFIKQERPPSEASAPAHRLLNTSGQAKMPAMDAAQHHQFNYTPNRELFINNEMFDQLVKGMIDAEIAEQVKIRPLPKSFSTNEEIDFAINTRQYEHKQQKLVCRLNNIGALDENGRIIIDNTTHLKDKDRMYAERLAAMRKGIADNFRQRLKDYMHFQRAAQSDITSKFSSAELQKILGGGAGGGTFASDSQGNLASFGDSVDASITNIRSRSSSNSSDERRSEDQKLAQHELYKKELQTQKFYLRQKRFNTNPCFAPGTQASYFLALKRQNVLVVPHFAKIQGHELNLQNQYMNSVTVTALADFIIAQTKLFDSSQEIMDSYKPDADYDAQEREKYKEVSELQASQVIVEHFTVDDCGMKDADLAVILGAIGVQARLKVLTITNSELGPQSLVALIALMTSRRAPKSNSRSENNKSPLAAEGEQETPEPYGLHALNLTNLKCDPQAIEDICEVLDELASQGRPVPSLKLSELYLNRAPIVELLATQFAYNEMLQRLDLSSSIIKPAQLAEVLGAIEEKSLAGNLVLEHLSLSYVKLGVRLKKAADDAPGASLNGMLVVQNEAEIAAGEQADIIIKSICEIINKSPRMTHVDFSGMDLGERVFPLLHAVKNSKSIAAVHLHDNGFTRAQKDLILSEMGVETHGYHHLNDSSNMDQKDPMEHAILQQLFLGLDQMSQVAHKFFKVENISQKLNGQRASLVDRKKAYGVQLLNSQVKKELRKEQVKLRQEVQNGSMRREILVDDPMLFTRKLGHPELIFNEAIYAGKRELSIDNAEGRWLFQSSARDNECYVCHRHSYMQLYFSRETSRLDYQRLEDPELIDILKKAYNLEDRDSLKHGAPILLSSVNNWLLTRFIDVRVFAQLLKGEHDQFIENSVRKQSLEVARELEQSKEEYISSRQPLKKKDSSMTMNQREQQRMETETMRQIDDEIDYVRSDKEYIKKEVSGVKQRARNIKRQASGVCLALVGLKPIRAQSLTRLIDTPMGRRLSIDPRLHQFSALANTAPNSPAKPRKMKRKATADFSDDEEADLVDAVAEREWRDVMRKCQKYRDDMLTVNFPPFGGNSSNDHQIFTFAGFVRPGRHVIVVYDPLSHAFYRRDVIVDVRKSEIHIGRAKQDAALQTPTTQLGDNFIFKRHQMQKEEAMLKLYRYDTSTSLFTANNLRMNQVEFFEVMEYLPKVYNVLVKAYNLYLQRQNFPSSPVSKYIEFLEKIGLIQEKPSGDDVQELATREDVLKMFIFDPLFLTRRSHDDILEQIYDSQRKVIYRNEFIQKLLLISQRNLHLFKHSEPMRPKQRKTSTFSSKYSKSSRKNLADMIQENLTFIPFFECFVMPTIKSYIKKMEGVSSRQFVQRELWTYNVSETLQSNMPLIKLIFDSYKESNGQRRFTIESARRLLSDAGIVFNRMTNISHEERLRRLFAQSKQPVTLEDQHYFYTILDELEFCEFIARVADEKYNISISRTHLFDLKEKYQSIKRDKTMGDDEKKVPLDEIRTFVSIRGLCLERLEFKIYHLLKEHFEKFGEEKEVQARDSIQAAADKAGMRANLRPERLMSVKGLGEQLKEFELRRKTQCAINLDFDKLQKMEDETKDLPDAQAQFEPSISEDSQEDAESSEDEKIQRGIRKIKVNGDSDSVSAQDEQSDKDQILQDSSMEAKSKDGKI